jgi:serine/threonine protein kinase
MSDASRSLNGSPLISVQILKSSTGFSPSPNSHVSPAGRRLSALANVINRTSFRGNVPEPSTVSEVQALAEQTLGEARYSSADLTNIKRLGEGAFATVDLCTLPAAEEGGAPILVAVKRVRRLVRGPPDPHAPDEPGPLVEAPPTWHRDFLAEVVMMSAMRHPNVVACYGIVADDEHAVLQEFLDGGTLLDKLRKPSSYTLLDALGWLLDIARTPTLALNPQPSRAPLMFHHVRT